MALNLVNDVLIKARVAGEGDVRRLNNEMRGLHGGTNALRGAFTALKALGPPISAAAFLQGIKASVAYADNIGTAAKNTGLTARAYQELSFAAQQLDLEQGDLTNGLIRFNKVLGEAKQGLGESLDPFKRLGLDPHQFRDTDEAFKVIVQKLGQMKDGFQRAAILSDLFGRSAGPKLTEFVTTSADAVERLRREAHELGAVMDDDVIARADESQKKLDAMANVVKTQLASAMVDLAPIVTGIAQSFSWLSRQIRGALDASREFADGVSETLAFGIQVDEELRRRNSQRKAESSARAAAPGISAQFYAQNPALAGVSVAGQPRPPSGGGGEHFDPVEYQKQQDAIRDQIRKFNKEVLAAADAQRDQLDSLLAKYDPVSAQLRQLTADQIVLQEAAARGDQRAIDALNKMSEAYAEVGADAEEAGEKMAESFERASGRIEDAIIDLVRTGEANLGELVSAIGIDSLRSSVRGGLQAIGESFSKEDDENGLQDAAVALTGAASEQSAAAGEQGLVARLWQAVSTLFQSTTLSTSSAQTAASTGLATAGTSLNTAAFSLMSAATLLSTSAATDAIVMHSGGVVGAGTPTRRSVPLATFANAPRYHSGKLASDEYPAILQKGESVLTPAQMRAMGGGKSASVTITNNVDARGADPTSAANMMRALEATSRATEERIYEALRRGYAPSTNR